MSKLIEYSQYIGSQEQQQESLPNTKPFSLKDPKYDTTTYLGRFLAFKDVVNIRHSFYSNKRILQMNELIKQQEEKEKKQVTVYLTDQEIKDIRIAQTVVSSAIHPDTKQIMPWIMRLSSFVPVNIPIEYGFIIAKPTPFNTIFWQWINQTYNALLNYGNRNATSTYTTQDILTSYIVAVSSSISVGVSVRKVLEKYTKGFTGGKLILMNSMTSFLACAIGGYLNTFFMRQTELNKGIDILYPQPFQNQINKQMKSYGKSKICAKKAVTETALSRVVLASPLFLPALALYSLERARLMPNNKILNIGVQLSFITMELYFSVPFGVAVYPQFGTIKAQQLEQEFRCISDEQGQILKEFQYNKGL